MNEHEALKRLHKIAAAQNEVLKRLAQTKPFSGYDRVPADLGEPPTEQEIQREFADPQLADPSKVYRREPFQYPDTFAEFARTLDEWEEYMEAHPTPQELAYKPSLAPNLEERVENLDENPDPWSEDVYPLELEDKSFDETKHTHSTSYQAEMGLGDSPDDDWETPLRDKNTRKTFDLPDERMFRHPEDDSDVVASLKQRIERFAQSPHMSFEDLTPPSVEYKVDDLLDEARKQLDAIARFMGKFPHGGGASAHVRQAKHSLGLAKSIWDKSSAMGRVKHVENERLQPYPDSGGQSIVPDSINKE